MKKYFVIACIGLLMTPQMGVAAPLVTKKSANTSTYVDAWAQSWGKYYGEDTEEEEVMPAVDAWAQSWGKYYGNTEEETSAEDSTDNTEELCQDPYVDAWVYRLLCQ